MEEVPRGFVMTLPRTVQLPGEIWAWGQRSFRRFRVLYQSDQTLVGGLDFHRPPKSLKQFQSLVSTNLRNWGYVRENEYNRGWLRFCSAEEFKGIFLREEIHANWRRLAAKKVEQDVQAEVQRLSERRRVIKAGMKRMALKRAQKAFDALAAVIREKQAAREAKRAQFNKERFGVERIPHAQHSKLELDSCSSWADVFAIRGPPQTVEQLAVERICREQAQQAHYGGKPIGLDRR